MRVVHYTKILALTLLASVAGACDAPVTGEPVSFRVGGGTYAPLDFADNPGALNAFVYEPAAAVAGAAPLVVAMHACTQTANAYRAAGWEELADELGFYVLYPEQTSANNGATCFNWAGEYGDATNLMRGQGENQSIISMIESVQMAHEIDASRIYVTGHSGGGAQTALMMATWPDVFAGGGIFAGIPFHCTTTYNEVSSCLSPGLDKTPETHAGFVSDAYPDYAGPYPTLSIWHGSADFLVSPSNQTELLEQWTTVHGIDLTPDVTETVEMTDHAEYHDANGNVLVETYVVPGGGHATFNSPSQGCGSAGSYFEDRGVCGPRLIAEFWGLDAPPAGGTGDGVDADGGSGDNGGGDNGGGSGDNGGADNGPGDGGSAAEGDTGSGGGGGDDDDDGGDDGGDDDSAAATSGEPAIEDPESPKGVGQCAVSSARGGEHPGVAVLGLLLLFAAARRRRDRLTA